jgi:hypothetical protein
VVTLDLGSDKAICDVAVHEGISICRQTSHTFHGGGYWRTARTPGGDRAVSVLIL